MHTPLLVPQATLPAPAQPQPGDMLHGRGILGTHLLKVFEPGTDVPLIVVEVDPRIWTPELQARVWNYVVTMTQPPAPPERPPLALVE